MLRNTRKKRRATVLLLVVTLLALLFVIVTSFLSLARTNRALTNDVRKADLTKNIVEGMNKLSLSLIKDQIVDNNGRVLAGGSADSYSFENIPGYRKGNYIAPLEPYVDQTWTSSSFTWPQTYWFLERLKWPSLTTLDRSVNLQYNTAGTAPLNLMRPFALYELLRDFNPNNSSSNLLQSDVQWNARIPFMDADGDGIPDSQFLLMGPAIESANNMAGISIKLPRFGEDVDGDWANAGPFFQIWALPNFDASNNTFADEIWQNYDENARYEVAVRIVPHGGMVTLDSPILPYYSGCVELFNRYFTVTLFDSIRNPQDGRMSQNSKYAFVSGVPTCGRNRLFNELHEYQAAVEKSLRRRGFLPGMVEGRVNYNPTTYIPPVLAELQGQRNASDAGNGFRYTFFPYFGTNSSVKDPTNWQRINLADEDDGVRTSWSRAVAFNPVDYNLGDLAADRDYDRRHLITMNNNSDDLARRQTGANPNPTSASPLGLDSTGTNSALYEGELKFYLGEIAKAYDAISDSGGYIFQYNINRGNILVERLARLYFEMLASHSDNPNDASTANDEWGDVASNPPFASLREAVSRKQQAFMLAVNTIAFGAPRSTSQDPDEEGCIDTAVYTDNNGIQYFGYVPQPYFTEIIAYNKHRDDPNDPARIAIAVELYNPNDPYILPGTAAPPAPPQDTFGLNLNDFAISVDEVIVTPGGEVTPIPLTGSGRIAVKPNQFPGRSFLTVVLKPEDADNTHFDTFVAPMAPIINLVDSLNAPVKLKDDPATYPDQTLTIKLWRRSRAAGHWYVIDVIKTKMPTPPTSDDSDIWEFLYRDTSAALNPFTYYPLFGGRDSSTDYNFPRYARWNMITSSGSYSGSSPFDKTGRVTGFSPGTDSLNAPRALIGNAMYFDPDSIIGLPGTSINVPFAPTVPLITMNASTQHLLSLYPGDNRPASFPTVGFTLLIPRFSHVYNGTSLPMGMIQFKQWSHRGYSLNYPNSINYPLDFGHMPVFDNQQKVMNTSYLKTTGAVPWGLLVFDYFTTINPVADANEDGIPDVDPLQIPGRIDINTAPWFVLSKLPLMGPIANGSFTGSLPVFLDSAPDLGQPSPAFWDTEDGTFVGKGGWNNSDYTTERQLINDASSTIGRNLPYRSVRIDEDRPGVYRLGAWLAQAAVSYRDGIQYLPGAGSSNYFYYSDSQLRGGTGTFNNGNTSVSYRSSSTGAIYNYGTIRGAANGGSRPSEYGFITLGELLNVKGFDSSLPAELPLVTGDAISTVLGRGDYIRAISLLVQLDTQYLTTRSNTFTIYTTVMDRQNPEASVRSQVTVDRSNLLPRMSYFFCDPGATALPGDDTYYPASGSNLINYSQFPMVSVFDLKNNVTGAPGWDGLPDTTFTATNADEEPRIIASEQIGYFNARFDQ